MLLTKCITVGPTEEQIDIFNKLMQKEEAFKNKLVIHDSGHPQLTHADYPSPKVKSGNESIPKKWKYSVKVGMQKHVVEVEVVIVWWKWRKWDRMQVKLILSWDIISCRTRQEWRWTRPLWRKLWAPVFPGIVIPNMGIGKCFFWMVQNRILECRELDYCDVRSESGRIIPNTIWMFQSILENGKWRWFVRAF